MNRTRAAVALAVLFSVSALLGCQSTKGPAQSSESPQPVVAVKTPRGYAIHDVWTLKSGGKQNLDAVNCDSPHGPWHVVISGDLAAQGWSKFDAYYDITADPSTGQGTVRGEEHSVTTDGQTYDGPSTGTAQFTAEGDKYLIKMEIDYDITWRTPGGMERVTGQDRIKGHISRELHVIPATGNECG